MKHVSKIIMLSLITTQLLSAKIPYSIILPFEQYPTNDSIEKLIDPAPFPSTLGKKGKALTYFELKSPHRKRIYKQNKISLSGIPIAYYGYIGTTTEDGSIMFSRMHDESIFYILVCTKINPIFMLENTVHHLEIGKTNKYSG